MGKSELYWKCSGKESHTQKICYYPLVRIRQKEKIALEIAFANSLVIHEASTKEINTVEDVWKSEEEIT